MLEKYLKQHVITVKTYPPAVFAQRRRLCEKRCRPCTNVAFTDGFATVRTHSVLLAESSPVWSAFFGGPHLPRKRAVVLGVPGPELELLQCIVPFLYSGVLRASHGLVGHVVDYMVEKRVVGGQDLLHTLKKFAHIPAFSPKVRLPTLPGLKACPCRGNRYGAMPRALYVMHQRRLRLPRAASARDDDEEEHRVLMASEDTESEHPALPEENLTEMDVDPTEMSQVSSGYGSLILGSSLGSISVPSSMKDGTSSSSPSFSVASRASSRISASSSSVISRKKPAALTYTPVTSAISMEEAHANMPEDVNRDVPLVRVDSVIWRGKNVKTGRAVQNRQHNRDLLRIAAHVVLWALEPTPRSSNLPPPFLIGTSDPVVGVTTYRARATPYPHTVIVNVPECARHAWVT
ncbi:unnamed protein product [Notodromas monacha]|uniref:BTB domain-containing protein n=1 Tax=Notodromas monacha TaxID=399045 RepID=A0A7R9GFF6_9CRUS|nr:unnamed protein product [Notodromas monacha]CAG0920653.1 unnamed protein product [Notodromas monacha]